MITNRRTLAIVYNVSLWLLVVIPLALAFAGGVVGWTSVGVFITASILLVTVPRIATRVPEWFWTVLVLSVFAFAAVRYFASTGDLLDVGVEMLIFLASVRLISRVSAREDLQLFALSFLLLAASTVVDEGILYGLLFCVYVVVGTFSLTLFHFHSEIAVRADRDAIETSFNAQFVRSIAGVAALILIASAAFFFVFPRVGLGFFAQQKRAGTQMAGFSNSVELGQHGRIRSNPEVVLRIEIDQSEVAPLVNAHWRTITFDTYDGKRWTRPTNPTRRALVSDRLHPFEPGSEVREYSIYMEPLGENVLPVIWPTRAVELASNDSLIRWGPSVGNLFVDALGDVRHTVKNELGMQYRLAVGESVDFAKQIEPLSEEQQARYLQTPTRSGRFDELSNTIFAGLPDHRARARAVTKHMHTSYRYTTDLPSGGENPVDAFLFEHQTGHCEYFATATVLLLRSAGVPARLVNGFLGGEWNAVGAYWAVRHGDAHSWVEYYDPQVGWVPIDPTPPSMADSRATSSWFSSAADAAKLAWMKWVVEYDLSSQISLATSVFSALKPAAFTQNTNREEDRDEEASASGIRMYLLGAGLILLVFIAFRSGQKGLRPRRVVLLVMLVGAGAGLTWWATTSYWGALLPALAFAAGYMLRSNHLVDPIFETYRQVQAAIHEAGFQRNDDEGSDRFLDRAGRSFPEIVEIEQFRKLYIRSRFGGYEVAPETLVRLAAAIQSSMQSRRK